MKGKNIFITLTVIVIVVLFFLKWSSVSTKEQKTPVIVQVKKIIKGNVPIYIEAVGTLAASQDVDISFRVTGYVDKILFKEGSFVNKGDLLMTINSEWYNANLNKNLAALEYDKADLKLKKFYVTQNSILAKTGALASQTYESMKIDYAKAIAKLKEDEASIVQDRLNMKYCSLYAPIDGIIGFKRVDIGALIDSAIAIPTVANIKAIDPLFVRFTVSELDALQIKKAVDSFSSLKLLVYIDEKGRDGIVRSKEYEGRLEYLNNSVNPTSSTISLQAILPNHDKVLLPGLYVKVKLLIENRNDTLLIPKDAIIDGPQGQYIFIVGKDNKVEIIDIVTGQDDGDFCTLEKGSLKEGDQALVAGYFDLSPGDLITIKSSDK